MGQLLADLAATALVSSPPSTGPILGYLTPRRAASASSSISAAPSGSAPNSLPMSPTSSFCSALLPPTKSLMVVEGAMVDSGFLSFKARIARKDSKGEGGASRIVETASALRTTGETAMVEVGDRVVTTEDEEEEEGEDEDADEEKGKVDDDKEEKEEDDSSSRS